MCRFYQNYHVFVFGYSGITSEYLHLTKCMLALDNLQTNYYSLLCENI